MEPALSLRQPEQEANILLASVSRSFYLTIRALPRALRRPIRTAYLLARATDTIADSPGLSVAERLVHLRALREVILGTSCLAEAVRVAMVTAPSQQVIGEKILLTQLTEVLEDYRNSGEDDYEDVRWVLEQITTGQEEDLLTPVLTTAEQLERYTWLVAGSVGEFWTKLASRKLKNYANLSEAEMIRLGADFGKGLQLVNILRDLPEDLAHGRSYLPPGTDYADWRQRAEVLLENGWRYVLALRSWRLRFACALPALIGRETLRLLKKDPARAQVEKLKISRKAVQSILIQAAFRAPSRRLLSRYFDEETVHR